MEVANLKSVKLPDNPGVYFFLGKNKKILYIGKATSLKNRVRSYFVNDIKEKRSELIEKMVEEAITVEFTETDSVLEALILETNLIRTHKPHFNTKSKDDKSYNHLVITNEEWPRVLVVRGRDLNQEFDEKEIKYEFGPFTSGSLFREALKIVRKLFQYYDTTAPVGTEKTKMARGKIDFNRQIGLYPEIGQKESYLRTIRHLKMFFEGKKSAIIKEMEKDMMKLAKAEKFEEASIIKRKIFALNHIQDIALVKDDYKNFSVNSDSRVEAYDVAHSMGKDMVGVMVVVQNGEAIKSEYRKFKINSVKQANDPAALKEMLERRFKHDNWPLPALIVVDGNIIQINAAKKVVEAFKLDIKVVSVVKDERHKASKILADEETIKKHKFDILLSNAEAHRFAIGYYRNLARKSNLK